MPRRRPGVEQRTFDLDIFQRESRLTARRRRLKLARPLRDSVAQAVRRNANRIAAAEPLNRLKDLPLRRKVVVTDQPALPARVFAGVTGADFGSHGVFAVISPSAD